ncbi:histidine phosphatase family protein [soil metagenome]
MKRLFLARHAFAGSNHGFGTASCTAPGDGLTTGGVEQGRRLATSLRNEQVDLGVATRLRRTQETLELALAGRDVTRLVVPELDEIRFGRFDGGPLATYRAWAVAERPDTDAPGGGESRAAAAARFAGGLRLLLARPEDTILAVGHALVVRYVLDAANGLVPAALIEPVEHAVAHLLDASEVARAVDVLEAWSGDPSFRSGGHNL